jgi:hypothetical protein
MAGPAIYTDYTDMALSIVFDMDVFLIFGCGISELPLPRNAQKRKKKIGGRWGRNKRCFLDMRCRYSPR